VIGDAPQFVTTDDAWLNGWRGASVFEVRGASLDYLAPLADWRRSGRTIHLPGTVLPGFRDSHVHLGLIDAAALAFGGVSRVVDLGWEPTVAAQWMTREDVSVEIVGAFLTAPGGYPSGSRWTPDGSCLFISTPDEAAAAIAKMKELGAAMIKIALNSDVGPVFSFNLLEAVVALAHAVSLPVVAHAQGVGQASRAARAGVDLLAHTPWSERVSDDELAFAAKRCAWISTLDIHGWGQHGHDYDIAVDNLGRFAALGGRVIYGTDLGNGPLPVGINPREIEGLLAAGLSRDAVIASMTPGSPSFSVGRRFSWIPGPRPGDSREFAEWVSTARVVSTTDIEETVA
jgi:imidazolonepropionase-like amidohydrolase